MHQKTRDVEHMWLGETGTPRHAWNDSLSFRAAREIGLLSLSENGVCNVPNAHCNIVTTEFANAASMPSQFQLKTDTQSPECCS